MREQNLEKMREQNLQSGAGAPGKDDQFCLRQFEMVTFQEYSYSPHGANAEDWLRERLGS
jgi:hypothetical protein